MLNALLTVLLFCRALSANDIRAFIPLIGGEHYPPTRLLRRVRAVTDNFDCVTIASYRWKIENGEIVVDIDAEGITRNAKHERRAIPSRWYLRSAGLGAPALVVAFDDDVSRLEARLIEAPSDAERDKLVAQYGRDVDIAAARQLSEDVPLSDAAKLSDAAEFLVNWSRDTENRELESYALCALGNVDKVSKGRLFDAARDAARQSQSCDAIAYADYQARMTLPAAARLDLLYAVADAVDSLDNPRPAILALGDIAGIYSISYEYSKFFVVDDRLEEVARRYGNVEGVARAVLFRGRTAISTYDAELTIKLMRQARVLADQAMASKISASSCIGLYGSYDYKMQYREALQSLFDTLRMLPAEEGDFIVYTEAEIAKCLVDRFHDLPTAELHYDVAARVSKDYPRLRSNVYSVGTVLRFAQGRFDEAIALGRMGIADDPSSLDWNWRLKDLIGLSLIDCGQLEDGIDELRGAIDYIEARRAISPRSAMARSAYGDQRSEVYRDLIAALISGKHFDEAFSVFEQFKTHSLAESLPVSAHNLALTAEEKQRETELNRRIIDWNRTVLTATGDQEADARRQLRIARADLDQFTSESFMRHTAAAGTTEEEPGDIGRQWSGAPVVEYIMLPGAVGVFVIHGGKVAALRLTVTPEELESRATRFIDRIQKRDLDYEEDGRALYDALIAPIADLLPPDGILNVVPDAFLWKLPFDALLARSHHFLAERYAISYAPSFLMLSRAVHRRQATHPRYDVLALGDPQIASATSRIAAAYRSLALGAIPDARTESRAVAKVYGPQRSTVLIGASARETLLKRVIGDYRIVHLATHGVVDDRSPLYSAVVLASAIGDPDDGLLEMREMSDLDLHADLVVLSGCDTARGEVLAGEGVIGMSWALFSAGCPTTVVSQWKAMSRSTADLMIAFHKHLHAGEPKAAALRHARLDLMKNPAYHHPFYWAPFVMVGEGEGRIR